MRARKARRRRGGVDDGVLPLINVVFLLLIFFMVAGRLASGDPFRIEPLRAAAEGAPPGGEPLLLVAADGRLALDGEAVEREVLPARLAGVERLRVKADAAADSVALARLLAEVRAAADAEAWLMVEPRAGAGP